MAVALSIRQPWAWLIVQGLKPVENRSRRSRYRGPLLIHAGRTLELDDVDWINATLIGQGHDGLPRLSSLPRGGVVGRVDMVDCVTSHSSPWFAGPFGYVFRAAAPRPLYPCPGRLGFFEVELPEQLPL